MSMHAFEALLARLTLHAQQLAEARGEALALERRDPARRWRNARLLWPQFTKG